MNATRTGIRLLPPGDHRAAVFEAVRERCGAPAAFDDSRRGISPDASGLAAWRGGEPVARCSVQVVDGLYGAPGPSGLVGHYEAADADAGTALLRHARQLLAAQGAARVLGPMNGSTWARYRLALPGLPGDPFLNPQPFMSEPQNRFDYPEQFEAAGFAVAARYESRIDLHPEAVRPGASALRDRLASRGVTVAPICMGRYEEELEELFALSRDAFAANLYYRPIDFDTFRSMLEGIRPWIDPKLVRLARSPEGKLIGYLFAFPDPLTVEHGRPTRVVAKTGATAPDARRWGLGMHLLDEVRALAHRSGCRSVIHALMHVDNPSMKSSARHESLLFRRYALYEWIPGPTADNGDS